MKQEYAQASSMGKAAERKVTVAVEAPRPMETGGEAQVVPSEVVLTRDESMNWTDAALLWRVLSASAGIALLFQMIYLAADWSGGAPHGKSIVYLHLFNLLVAAVFLGITYLHAYREWFPQIILGGCTSLFVATAALSVLTLNRSPLTFTLTITMVSAAALVPWNWRWQAGLAIAAGASFVAFTLVQPGADPHPGYDWFALVTAAGVAQYIMLLGQHYRREIASRINALNINHSQLAGSEAKLRKIFETSSDMITINRLSDGRYIDVNNAFLMTGYSRDDALGKSAKVLGLWSDGVQFRAFLRALRTTGSAVNMDFECRNKDGSIVPFLISAKVLELDGKKCVVSIAHDIRSVKQAEAELIGARERMRGQIETLERTEERLRTEILERTRAMEQREMAIAASALATQRLSESEAKLRKIFATTTDAISISRLSDGRYLDVNQAFCRLTGYSPEEALAHSPGSLGIWADREQLRSFLHKIELTKSIENLEQQLRTKRGVVLRSAGISQPSSRPKSGYGRKSSNALVPWKSARPRLRRARSPLSG
jgi:PAS domain S-box-containing protein